MKNSIKNMNPTAAAVIRFVVAGVAAVNAILTAHGMNPIPLNESLVTEWLSYGFAGAMLVWTTYKDAPITKAGRAGHEVTKAIKEDGYEVYALNDLYDDEYDEYDEEG